MRTSLNEIQQIEEYLFHRIPEDESLVMDAKIILSSDLQDKVLWQKRTYAFLREYGRMKLREEIKKVHQTLFTEPKHEGFKDKILKIFS